MEDSSSENDDANNDSDGRSNGESRNQRNHTETTQIETMTQKNLLVMNLTSLTIL